MYRLSDICRAPTGDTITLGDEKAIESIVIDKDTFYYEDGYLELMENFKVKIARKKLLVFSNRQKLGGMGELSSASIETNTRVGTEQGMKDIVPQEILTFSEKTTYYIGDKFNHFKPLNKKNLYTAYSKQHAAVAGYLEKHPVNFFKEADVNQLIGFLKSL